LAQTLPAKPLLQTVAGQNEQCEGASRAAGKMADLGMMSRVDVGRRSANLATGPLAFSVGLASYEQSSWIKEREIAFDQTRAVSERINAVRTIAQQSDPGVRDVLREISAANPNGDAADYEVHRAAVVQLLEKFGEWHSLRPMSLTHAQALVAQLRTGSLKAVISDYDDTLAPHRHQMASDTANAWVAVGKTGIQPVILTARPAQSDHKEGEDALADLNSVAPAERNGLLMSTGSGHQTWRFDANGQPVLESEEKTAWTDGEKCALLDAVSFIARDAGGSQQSVFQPKLGEHDLFVYLPVGMPLDEILKLARRFPSLLPSHFRHNRQVVLSGPTRQKSRAEAICVTVLFCVRAQVMAIAIEVSLHGCLLLLARTRPSLQGSS